MSRNSRRRESRLVPAPQMAEVQGPGLIVLMPTRGRVTIETVTALSHLDGIPAVMRTASRMAVSDARNALAKMSLDVPVKARFSPKGGWYCLWVDDDAWWRRGSVLMALQTMVEHPEIDVLAGWFGPRSAYANPAMRNAQGSWPRPGIDCQLGDVVEIDRCGMHWAIHRLDLLERLSITQLDGKVFSLAPGDEAEDYSFCRRVRESGGRIWAHTGIPVAHIGDDGQAFVPGEAPYRVVDDELLKSEQPTIRFYGTDIEQAKIGSIGS